MDNLPKYVISVNQARYDNFQDHIQQHAPSWDIELFQGVLHPKIGCTLSHLKLWEEIEDNVYVVFEDDAIFQRKLNEQDEKIINTFLSDNTQHILHLGWSPSVHRIKSIRSGLYIGHTLDTHAYIIKKSFAKGLLYKYGDKLRQNPFGIIGAIDTVFLIEEVSFFEPMLFVQDKEPRYNNVNKQGFIVSRNNVSVKYWLYWTGNYLFFNRSVLIGIIVLIIVLIIYFKN